MVPKSIHKHGRVEVMRPIFTLIALLAIQFGTSVACYAQTGQRLALVIGNDQYKKVEVLKNARNDARLVAATLKAAKFEVTIVEDANRAKLFGAIEAFGRRISRGDEVVFFYAGHGVQIGSNSVLLPVDITAESERQVERDGVPLVDVQDALKDARVSILVIDACRDNPFPRQGTRSMGGTRGLIPPEAANGQAIIMSAGRNQKAMDSVPGQHDANGLFTSEFVRVIRTPGLDVRAALVQVRDQVDDKAKRASHAQRPSLVDDLRGNFYFFVAPGATVIINPRPMPSPPVRVQTGEEIEQQAWEDAQKADTVESLRAYLAEYPMGRFASRARIRMATLRGTPVKATPRPDAVTVLIAPTQPAQPGVLFRDCEECPEMMPISAGTFEMGSPSSEVGRHQSEGPLHRATVSSFSLGRTHVTRGQYAAFVNETSHEIGQDCSTGEIGKGEARPVRNWREPGHQQQDNHPVVCVNWNDALAYVDWLSRKTGKRYRLPTEAEWEYAARAGTTTARYWGGVQDPACSFSNLAARAGKPTLLGLFECDDGYAYSAPTKSFKPNAFGLYDMIGNAWQWVEDCWHGNYNGSPADGSAWVGCDSSVGYMLRGGSWRSDTRFARSAGRERGMSVLRLDDTGFRVARAYP